MQNASYIFNKFSENLSKINTITQLIELSKSPDFDIEIDFAHIIPTVLTWHPASDSFFEEYEMLVRPKIFINGKTFSPPKMIASQFPLGVVDCESVFLEALKQAICDIEVWRMLL